MWMGKVFGVYRGLSFEKQRAIATVLHSLVNAPLLGNAYRSVYRRTIRRKTRGVPRVLTIETCNVCNLECIMCPHRLMTRGKQTMDMGLYAKIIDSAAAMGIRELSLTNYGEPLLDKSLVQRIKYAKGRGMRVALTTNGTLLVRNDNTTKLLESGLDWIDISIDGITKQTYERIREGGRFEDVMDGFAKLIGERGQQAGTPKVGINCCVQAANSAELRGKRREFHRLFEGADSLFFGPEYVRADEAEPLPQDMDAGVPAKGARFVLPCRLPFDTITVLVDGSVALCCMDYDGRVRLGNLASQSVEQVWSSEAYTMVRELHLEGQGTRIQTCATCARFDRSDFEWWQ